jgi:uncharacterized membrane protein YedE/YeeE
VNRLLRSQGGMGVGAGLTIGVLLSERLWLVFVLGLAAGVLLTGLARAWRDLLAAFSLWKRQARAREAVIQTTPQPTYRVPRRPAQDDTIPF